MKTDGANAGLSANQDSKGGFSQNIESSKDRLNAARVARNDARAALAEARNSGSKSERQAAFSELRQAKLEIQEARADLREERGGRAGSEVSSPGTGGNFFNGNEFIPETDSNGSLTPEQKLQFGIPPGATENRGFIARNRCRIYRRKRSHF